MTIILDLDETLLSTSLRQFKVIEAYFHMHETHLKHSYQEYLTIRKNEQISNIEWLSRYYTKSIDFESVKQFYLANIESPNFLIFDSLIVNLTLMKDLKNLSPNLNFILVSLRSNKENSTIQLRNIGLHSYLDEIHFLKHRATNPKINLVKNLTSKHVIDLYIGDSIIDFDAAYASGIKFIPVCTGIIADIQFPKTHLTINDILRQIANGTV